MDFRHLLGCDTIGTELLELWQSEQEKTMRSET